MKTINNYITEKLKITKTKLKGSTKFTLFPKTKKELFNILNEEIDKNGPKCSLNHIDTSEITDMSDLFSWTHSLAHWNGDMSEWNVSNVTNMLEMFKGSYFDGDLSRWDVSKVENMSTMFWNSKFNQDISNWKINNKCDTINMFYKCQIKDRYKPKNKMIKQ
jgi:hypothetical protein